MKTIYLLMSHSDQESDFEIEVAKTDFTSFQKALEEEWELTESVYDEEFNEEVLNKRGYFVFGYYWEMDSRYVAYKFDIDIAPGKEIFALCANGNELCWEGDVLGIYADIDEVKKAIIEATNLSEFDTEEEINNALGELWEKYHSYLDGDSFITYKCIPITI